ncbi:MAG: exodeoxyribonuclease VII small subunit [Kiritimatiellae bacterium]|nr:exodeoxyribonuclease VII small subunit [Kiritimatiellia bacterium]MCO5061775.1 exodeoxyribonuclease VII small subunit [Kiritimatiellia bacterium]MCO5069329.1 exodeoxyribonuclease VII small subunit [Kiritimatiellia bacterium]
MSPRETTPADDPLDFEKALTRLESLVKEMETGNLSLDKMMAHFEEGSKLVKTCDQKLNEVEKKIEKLVKKGDSIASEPFAPTDSD